MPTPTKLPCVIRLDAYPAWSARGCITSLMSGLAQPNEPHVYLELDKAEHIPVLIERFGLAVQLLYPDASFGISCYHQPRMHGRESGKKKPNLDRFNAMATPQKHAHVRPGEAAREPSQTMWNTIAPEMETLHDDPQVVEMAALIRQAIRTRLEAIEARQGRRAA